MTAQTARAEKPGVDYVSVWLTTANKKFYVTEAAAYEYDIEEIAHALSNTCRFNGHSSKFYSVAEHSVHVARLSYEATKDFTVGMQALLHDGAEAFVGDIVTPLKVLAPQLEELEDEILAGINRTFGLPTKLAPVIKPFDWAMCLAEKQKLLPNSPKWPGEYDADPNHMRLVKGLSPTDARKLFLDTFVFMKV